MSGVVPQKRKLELLSIRKAAKVEQAAAGVAVHVLAVPAGLERAHIGVPLDRGEDSVVVPVGLLVALLAVRPYGLSARVERIART